MNWLLHVLITSLLLIVVAGYANSFYIANVQTAIIASFILAILNLVVKPILVFLTLPITFLTFGLFLFVVNAMTLMLTAYLLGSSFVIDGFGTALLASVAISLFHVVIQRVILDPLRKKKK